jgi:hypothetical protein
MAEPDRSPPRENLEVDARASREEEEGRVSEAAALAARRRAGDAARKRTGSQSWLASLGAARFVLAALIAAGAIVGCVVLLGAGSWWALPLVVLVLVGALASGALLTLRATTEVEKPAPETVARLEEEGVRDPEADVNERSDVAPQDEREMTPSPDSRPVGSGEG